MATFLWPEEVCVTARGISGTQAMALPEPAPPSNYNLVDPASSHMLVSKTKPCMSQYKFLYCKTANGSLKQS